MKEERRELEERAIRYRQLAREVADQQTAQRILALAEELQSRSAEIRNHQVTVGCWDVSPSG